MAIVCGIDEVGYGPLLGPLVIAAAAFNVPQERIRDDFWKMLEKSTSPVKKHLRGRLLVADSKKAYNRKSGTDNLRRTTLAALKALGANPASFSEMLELLSPATVGRLGRYPWYGGLGPKPIEFDDEIAIASKVFIEDMTSNRMSMASLKCECLDAGHYNELVAKFRNKASLSFSSVCSLIYDIYSRFDEENVYFMIDRQGGRTNYVPVLSRMFEGMQITVIRQNDRAGSYRLQCGRRNIFLHFSKGADSRFFPVSLASMAAKYLREIMIEELNKYFLNLVPGVEPTAGYYTDGSRFIKEIESVNASLLSPRELLVRSR
ncbi:ribonuclease HII [Limihaloglobus sulfuriphilus]|uniref:Ribonuclease HIII n=1 Tax=Limihaloglobus sulfuriphilus TaxID=1851148 RepID=A0A1Q2MCB0_9BACT|nr:hypothetical protein [Limihaloglobus sulfuriphilus]AQQ70299.1 ribonuclease HII [Limihaloglobus sulfuriphilus]